METQDRPLCDRITDIRHLLPRLGNGDLQEAVALLVQGYHELRAALEALTSPAASEEPADEGGELPPLEPAGA